MKRFVPIIWPSQWRCTLDAQGEVTVWVDMDDPGTLELGEFLLVNCDKFHKADDVDVVLGDRS